MSVEVNLAKLEKFLLEKLDSMKRVSKWSDLEDKHRAADNILCNIVRELGPIGNEIAEEFYGMDKWYS